MSVYITQELPNCINAYPLGRCHVVEVFASMERILGIPLERPLRLVRQDCFLECTPVMTSPVARSIVSDVPFIIPSMCIFQDHNSSSLYCRLHLLDRLLSVQDQRQQRAQQALYLWTRHTVYDSSFDVLRSEVRCLARKGLLEARSEHYDELPDQKVSRRVPRMIDASQARHFVFKVSATHGNVRIIC